jgi:hypothetical protein
LTIKRNSCFVNTRAVDEPTMLNNFPLAAFGIFRRVFNAQTSRGCLFGNGFFAQLLHAAAKEQQGVNLGSSIGAQKLVTEIAKDVQKKTAGSGWGAGAMIDALTGALLFSLRWAA